MRTLPIVALLLTTGVVLAAQRSAPAMGGQPPSDLSLTVYNNDLVLVQDIRTVDLPKGRSRIEFPGVSAAIRPETVSLLAKGLSVIEQNFDYDLLTPAKMMEKQVGRQVELVRTNPANGRQTRETATVLSVNSGVVLKIGGRIEALRDDGLPTRVVFRSIPDNLRASPTLSVIVDAEEAGPHRITLSYLARGLSWSAAYVGMYDDTRDMMGLQGWITIRNSSGTSFKDANAELIAGSINTNAGGQHYNQANAQVKAGTGQQTGAEQVADFYAYHLPERMTVANEQTKQVAFLDLDNAQAKKTYVYNVYGFNSLREADHASVFIDFTNTGEALPEGVIRVYMRDAKGEPKFLGENGVAHTPAGSDVSIEIGQAFDVTVQSTVVSSTSLDHGARYEMAYTLRNARSEPVTVKLRQQGFYLNGRVVEESLKSERVDASTLLWDVPVPANGETKLTATVETGY